MIYIVAVERTEQYLETIEVDAENEDEARERVYDLLFKEGFTSLFPDASVSETNTIVDSVYPKEEDE